MQIVARQKVKEFLTDSERSFEAMSRIENVE